MPTTFFVNSFGSYSFATPSVGAPGALGSIQPENQGRDRTATRPNIGGRYSAGAKQDQMTVILQGKLIAADYVTTQSFRDAWDVLAAALAIGTQGALMIDSDRYANCEVKAFGAANEWKGMPWRDWSATLVSYDDPPIWDNTSVSQLLATNGTPTTWTPGGQGAIDTSFAILVTAAPGGGLITITDGNGNTFTLAPPVTGTYYIDSYTETVTLGTLYTGADETAYTTGDFLSLSPGSNSLTITLTGGVTCGNSYCNYRKRYVLL